MAASVFCRYWGSGQRPELPPPTNLALSLVLVGVGILFRSLLWFALLTLFRFLLTSCYSLTIILLGGGFIMSLQKVQINLEAGLVRQIDDYAASLHITRTAAVSVLLSQALQSQQLMSDLSSLVDLSHGVFGGRLADV